MNALKSVAHTQRVKDGPSTEKVNIDPALQRWPNINSALGQCPVVSCGIIVTSKCYLIYLCIRP